MMDVTIQLNRNEMNYAKQRTNKSQSGFSSVLYAVI